MVPTVDIIKSLVTTLLSQVSRLLPRDRDRSGSGAGSLPKTHEFGKTRVYFLAEAFEVLEKLRTNHLLDCARYDS